MTQLYPASCSPYIRAQDPQEDAHGPSSQTAGPVIPMPHCGSVHRAFRMLRGRHHHPPSNQWHAHQHISRECVICVKSKSWIDGLVCSHTTKRLPLSEAPPIRMRAQDRASFSSSGAVHTPGKSRRRPCLGHGAVLCCGGTRALLSAI
jgi:hypothetical protein